MKYILLTLAFLLPPAIAKPAPIVGIFGDVHGDREIVGQVLSRMRVLGVTDVIVTGDLVRWEGPSRLHDILAMITPMTGVSKERIHLIPGNWEHETGFPPEEMNQVMRIYGNLVFEKYDGHGFVEINGEKIMVSHFPQHQLPEEFLPPPKYRRRLPNQAFVMDTIERGIFPPADVVFEIFAHSHVGGLYFDAFSGKVVVNAGVLDGKAKSPDEPRAFAVYDSATKQIHFHSGETGELLKSGSVVTADVCPLLLLCLHSFPVPARRRNWAFMQVPRKCTIQSPSSF